MTAAKPKWTPGPWVWIPANPSENDRGGPMERLVAADGTEICNFGDDTQYYPTEGKAPLPANAALMAAAPDLAEALRAMTERYVSLVNSGDAGFWDPEQEAEVKAARATLAKAGAA